MHQEQHPQYYAHGVPQMQPHQQQQQPQQQQQQQYVPSQQTSSRPGYYQPTPLAAVMDTRRTPTSATTGPGYTSQPYAMTTSQQV